MMKKIFYRLLYIFFAVSFIFVYNTSAYAQKIPEITFEELIILSESPNHSKELNERVDKLLHTPIIDNSINTGNDFIPLNNNELGSFIRVANWNIARGMNVDKIKLIFKDPNKLLETVNKRVKKNPKKLNQIKEQIELLKSADIIFLNEVDIGMPRTKYKNVAKELAQTIGYNYAFGIEFLEIDPVHLGTGVYKWSEEKFLIKNGDIEKDLKIDKEKYKGLHGNAILSRFPLENVRIIRLPIVYNWYHHEKKDITHLEETRRNLAKGLFNAHMLREIRLGSRIALIADISIPGFDEKATLVCVHIENRTKSKNRAKQIKYLLRQLKHIDNPLILAGDFNTTMADGSSTSITKEFRKKITDPHFIGKTCLMYGNPYSLAINTTAEIANFVRRATNPTVINIPLFAPNPERKLFNVIKKFKFDDKNIFDVRGNADKSYKKRDGFLSNSNQRQLKGFTPTFIFERDYGLMKYKLDWIFVKAYAKSKSPKESYIFAPHFGRTLLEMNYAFEKPLSDHVPLTVDLPLSENKKINSEAKKTIDLIPDIKQTMEETDSILNNFELF